MHSAETFSCTAEQLPCPSAALHIWRFSCSAITRLPSLSSFIIIFLVGPGIIHLVRLSSVSLFKCKVYFRSRSSSFSFRLSSFKSSNVQVSGLCVCIYIYIYILLTFLDVPPPPALRFLKTLLLVWAPTMDTQTCCDPSSSATPLQFCRRTIRGCRLFNFILPCFVCFTSAILSRQGPSTRPLAVCSRLPMLSYYSSPHCLGTRGNGRSEMCCLVSRVSCPLLACCPLAAIAASHKSRILTPYVSHGNGIAEVQSNLITTNSVLYGNSLSHRSSSDRPRTFVVRS